MSSGSTTPATSGGWACSSCGAMNRSGMRFCTACGVRMATAAPASAAAVVPSAPVSFRQVLQDFRVWLPAALLLALWGAFGLAGSHWSMRFCQFVLWRPFRRLIHTELGFDVLCGLSYTVGCLGLANERATSFGKRRALAAYLLLLLAAGALGALPRNGRWVWRWLMAADAALLAMALVSFGAAVFFLARILYLQWHHNSRTSSRQQQ